MIKMKSALLVVLLAAAATAAVISNEVPDVVRVPDVDEVADVEVNEISEEFVTDGNELTDFTELTDEVEEPAQTALDTRQNLNLGNITSKDRLVIDRELKDNGTADMSKVLFVIVQTYQPISAIRLNRVGASQGASTYIKGGIGSWQIIIKIRSAVGRGFHYKMHIYVRQYK